MSCLLHVNYNTLNKADGSATFSNDKTVLISAVYGPLDINSTKENYEKASIECILKKNDSNNKDDNDHKFLENFICSSLESSISCKNYPRTSISIIIQELQCRNNLTVAAINSSICALMDAGINQKYLISAVCLAVKDNQLILNPSLDCLKESSCQLIFVLENQKKEFVSILNKGAISIKLFEKAMELAKQECNKIFIFYKESLKKRFSL